MPQSAKQIVSWACAVAKAPGMTVLAGQLLNTILSDLCQTYDFQVARKVLQTTLPTTSSQVNGVTIYGGPLVLPANFLRCDAESPAYYMLSGVPMPLTPCDVGEFDMMVQMAGNAAYPAIMATDVSQSPAQAFFWPPSSATLPLFIPYFCQMDDIATPETSDVVPWFPNQTYVQTRLAGELMKLTDDDRKSTFLGDEPDGAQGILDRYLKMAGDKTNRAQTVKLDPRTFGRGFNGLPNTKAIGFGPRRG